MRRWNGWGDDSISAEVPETARALLVRLLGPGRPPVDATLERALASLPASRLPAHPLVSTDPETRARHARGQSLPDWVALRSGRLEPVPDGVAFPTSDDDVRDLLASAARTEAAVVPYGGGTSVVGGIDPPPDGRPGLTVSLARLTGLRTFEPRSGLARFGAGTTGPAVEAALGRVGWTLGHYPQSWEYSTVGGWVASRSTGQQSIGFGRIEALFAGGRLLAPVGVLELPPHPASAAGPDLRQLVLGSEGRLGILTEAVMRAVPRPGREVVLAAFMPDFEAAMVAVRDLVLARLPLSMVRLSTPAETITTLAMAGHPDLVRALRSYLRMRGLDGGRCLLLLALTGPTRSVARARREVRAILGPFGAVAAPGVVGRRWMAERFRSPYLRNALWEAGYAVDTVETAADWSRIPALARSVAGALRGGLADEGERVHAFSHLSHVYPSGSSLYTTFVFRVAGDPDRTLARWRRLKGAVSEAIVAGGGTISHQHGVGTDHRPYLVAEKGELGLAALEAVAARFDPDGRMNPGKLLSDAPGMTGTAVGGGR